MNDLRDHEPITHVLWQYATRSVWVQLVQLSVGEYPKYYRKDSRDGLRCYEMRCIGLYLAALHLMKMYLLGEENELTQNGNSLEVLSECPSIITEKGTIQAGVEEHGQHSSKWNQIIAFNYVEIFIITGFERN